MQRLFQREADHLISREHPASYNRGRTFAAGRQMSYYTAQKQTIPEMAGVTADDNNSQSAGALTATAGSDL
jgi:hypothetical protein